MQGKASLKTIQQVAKERQRGQRKSKKAEHTQVNDLNYEFKNQSQEVAQRILKLQTNVNQIAKQQVGLDTNTDSPRRGSSSAGLVKRPAPTPTPATAADRKKTPAAADDKSAPQRGPNTTAAVQPIEEGTPAEAGKP